MEERTLTLCPKSLTVWDDVFLKSDDPNAVRRLMILDSANILHATSNIGEKKSAIGLLTLMRYLLSNQFDVQAVFSEKYIRNDEYKHSNPAQQLIAADLGVVAPTNILDDRLCLEIARQTFGVVISQDHFEDHLATPGRTLTSKPSKNQKTFRFAENDLCSFEVKSNKQNEAYRWTANNHFVGEKHIRLNSFDENTFFACPSDVRWALANYYREQSSEIARIRSVRLIDRLIESALGF